MASYGQKNSANGVLGLNASGVIASPTYLGTGINANQIADGSVTNTAFQYLAGATSNIQAQINNIAAGIVNFEAFAAPTVNIDVSNPGTDTFDGVVAAVGASIFLIPAASGGAQTDATEGGIWVFNGDSVAMTRLPAMSTWNSVVSSRVYVAAGGVANGGTNWINTNQPGGTLGTTPISYIQGTDSLTAGTGVTISGNVISIGQSVATNATTTFASENLTNNTNFLVAGTTNTTTFTMAALTASRVFTLPDADSNSIIPAVSATANQFVTYIDAGGVQHTAQASAAGLSDVAITTPTDAQVLLYNNGTSKWTNVSFSGGMTVTNAGVVTLTNSAVTGQALTGLATNAPGTVAATDTILQGVGKIASRLQRAIVTETANYAMQVTQSIVMANADAITVTLPDATLVVAGDLYTVKLLNFATCNVAPFGGQNLDGGSSSFVITGAYNSASFFSDGTQWLSF